ncbi:hypothetical protein ONS95_008440 [Cadophora gregata]|uniref:uncharacterized protein n=1 Tax=Cadophora gregata TaxID=51156 RepID=UPI0026DA8CF5|nr:uncharacterized protein ONS95_008440 [Cadophora gregata]KAK0126862.1 hypothetical protein ONS95_008440 [Cadophora gregata]
MAEEEQKPQKIPSWVDIRRPPKPTPPTPEQRLVPSANSRTPASASLELYHMRELGQPEHQHENAQTYSFMEMAPALHPLSLMNLQMSAILAAHHMGIEAPIEQWGHLNPDFVSPNGNIGLGYGFNPQENQATTGGADPAASVPLVDTEQLQQPHLGQIHDTIPDGQQARPSALDADTVVETETVNDDPFTGTLIEGVQSTDPPNSPRASVSVPKRQPEISAEEIDAIADRIFEDLSDEVKRQTYLPPSTATATAGDLSAVTISTNLPNTGPPIPLGLPTLPPTSQTPDNFRLVTNTQEQKKTLDAPSAPRLMIQRNGRDISKAGSAYLRQDSISLQGDKKEDTEKRRHVLEKPLATPSRNFNGKFRVREGTKRHGEDQKEASLGSESRRISEHNTQDAQRQNQKDINSENKHTSKEDGRLKSLLASTIAEAPSSPSSVVSPWVRPSSDTLTPTHNPFLEFDPSRLDSCAAEPRKGGEIALQEQHKQEFRRLTGSDGDKDVVTESGPSPEQWPEKKVVLHETVAEDSYESRVKMEQKHSRDDTNRANHGGDTVFREASTSLRAEPYADNESTEASEAGLHRKKNRRVRPNQYLKLIGSELSTRHAFQLTCLPGGSTEKQKRELLRKQEDELVKWHAAQELLRHEVVERSRSKQAIQDPPKRKATCGTEVAEDEGRRKLVRANDSTARESRVRKAPHEVSLILISDATVIVDGADENRIIIKPGEKSPIGTSDEKSEHVSSGYTDMTDVPMDDTRQESVADSKGILAVFENSIAFPQSRDPENSKFKDEYNDGMHYPAPTGVVEISRTREAMDSAEAFQTSVTPIEVQEARMTRTYESIESRSESPPIPGGEWILDNMLDSLPDSDGPRFPPAMASPQLSPARGLKKHSCVVS